MSRVLKVSREALERYFLENPKRTRTMYADLQRLFNVSRSTIDDSLKRYGICPPARMSRQILEDYLLSHPGSRISDVMRFFDVSYFTAYHYMHYYGLETLVKIAKRPCPFINPEALKSYIEDHHDATIREISTALNHSYGSTYKAIYRLQLTVKIDPRGRPRKKIVPPTVD